MSEPTLGGGTREPDGSSSGQERLLRFHAAWSVGTRPRIEDYLNGVPPEQIATLARQLVRLDAFHRWRQGDVPTVDDYRGRVPNLDGDTLASEIQAALKSDRPPHASDEAPPTKVGETATQPPSPPQFVTCPQCHNPIAMATPAAGEIICDGCGSSFRVDNVHETTTRQMEPRKLGRFQLLDRVGTGSFGTVWRARDSELHRIVAVKIPHSRVLEPAVRERFLREARAAAQLNHPGIVRLYEVPVIDDTPVLVSDLIDGLSLRELLEAGRPPFRVAAALAADIAEALDYAHRRGLVHRDIKPGNIIVKFNEAAAQSDRRRTPEQTGSIALWGKPIIVDFGLALRDEAELVMTMEGQLIGTPAYMSPEQISNPHRVDGRSDLYSLGVVLYEMLCGELPFRGSKAMVVQQVLHEEPRPPRRLNDKIPRNLETICVKAMAKEPAWRYESGAALASDLRHFLKGEPIDAVPVGRVERTWRWCRRNPLLAGLWSAVTLLLIVGIAVSSYFAAQASDRARLAEASQREAESSAREARSSAQQALLSARQARKEEDLKNRQWYDSKINLAGTCWREHRCDLVQQQLADVARPDNPASDLRGFDWHYLQRLCRLDLRTFVGHHGDVRAVAMAPSGRLIASAGADGTVRLWDVALNKEVGTLPSQGKPLTHLLFHPDGTRVVFGDEDGGVRMWNVETQESRELLAPCGARVTGLGLSRDGTRLAAATGGTPLHGGRALPGTVRFWDFKFSRESPPALHHTLSFDGVALSSDGQKLAVLVDVGRTDVVWLWDCTSRKKIREFPEKSCWLRSIAFSPDDRRLAWGGDERTVRIWDRDKDQVRTLTRHPGKKVFSLAFSLPDGQRLATAGNDDAITVWDAESGAETLGLTGHTGHVNCVCFSPDGARLVSGAFDGAVKLWDAVAEQEPVVLPHRDAAVLSLAYDRSGRLAYDAGTTIGVWDPQAMRKLWVQSNPHGSANGLTFSPDGGTLAMGDAQGIGALRDAATGAQRRSWQAHDAAISWVVYQPDGKRLVSCGYDHKVKLWNAENGEKLLELPRCKGSATSAAFSSDGRLLAVADGGGLAYVWSFDESRVVSRFLKHEGIVLRVAFHPRLPVVASAGLDGTVRVWDPLTGEEKLPALPGHVPGASRVCFSPDGARIATADYDGTVRIFDFATGGQLLTLEGHSGPVFGLAFSADGFQLASGSTDKTLRIWDARPLTSELLDLREARSLVGYLLGKELPPADVLKRVRVESAISDSVREKALELAEQMAPGR